MTDKAGPVGDPAWSPYWDHYTYEWKDGKTARLLKSETEIHKARDAGDLDEFPAHRTPTARSSP